MLILVIPENENNKSKEKRGENLVDITNEYNENERSRYESDRVLDEAVDEVKSITRGVINRVKDTIRTLMRIQ